MQNPLLTRSRGFFYVREKIRTPDLLIRSQTLYPAELRAQVRCFNTEHIVL